MKITILNGNPSPSKFDKYLDDLVSILDSGGSQITRLDLRDIPLKYCIGCFDCWTKTPGVCDTDQASHQMGRAVINSDFTLWAAPLKMGFPAALLKMGFDKHLPLIHPYMVVDQGEAHHLKRYEKYPRTGMLVEKESDTSENDLVIIRDIFSRTALNFKSKLDFFETTELDPDQLKDLILTPREGPHFYHKNPAPLPGMRINPPKRITIFNGSPRGKKGNTPIMLGEFMKGFAGEGKTHHLIRVNDLKQHTQAFTEAECVWIGFPLYTDGMPAVVKTFIESLESLKGRKNNPPLGFLVQSGFPEGVHSRYVERYLAGLAARLDAPYLGTIVKGNGEGTRIMPAEANRKLFENLQTLGQGIAERGEMDPEVLQSVAKPEHFPLILGPLFRAFLKTKMSHRYFDRLLEENDAYDRRNDRPFVELE